MQLNSLGKSKPVMLAAGLALSTFALDSSNISAVIKDSDTSKYIKEIESSSYDHLLLKIKFQEHYKNWHYKTLFSSNVNSIIGDPDFKAIVQMGKRVTPFILEELNKKPSLLVWALNFIYDKKISNSPKTTVEDACRLWIKELKG